MKVIHLAECEPGQHAGWAATVYRDAAQTGELCPQTTYMTEELYADEPVWVETTEDTPVRRLNYLIGYFISPRQGGMFSIGTQDIWRNVPISTYEDVSAIQQMLRANAPELTVISFSLFATPEEQ